MFKNKVMICFYKTRRWGTSYFSTCTIRVGLIQLILRNVSLKVYNFNLLIGTNLFEFWSYKMQILKTDFCEKCHIHVITSENL